jgi:DNA-binding NarL/FixJ family response regulator
VTRIRILLAEQRGFLREALQDRLEREDDLDLVAEAVSPEVALSCALELRPDVLLLGTMPGRAGVNQVAQTIGALPQTRVVVLARESDEAQARALLRLGISGYFCHTASLSELVNGCRLVYAGGVCLQPGMVDFLVACPSPSEPYRLTPREIEVVALVAEGLRSKEIATRLSVSVWTVHFHLRSIFSKTGATSRTQMVHLARERGWC